MKLLLPRIAFWTLLALVFVAAWQYAPAMPCAEWRGRVDDFVADWRALPTKGTHRNEYGMPVGRVMLRAVDLGSLRPRLCLVPGSADALARSDPDLFKQLNDRHEATAGTSAGR